MTFERVVTQISAPAWLGLTATPHRRDGLEGLVTMNCGPVRHRMSGGSPEDDGIEHVLAIHETDHPGSDDRGGGASPAIQTVFRGVVEDNVRTGQVHALAELSPEAELEDGPCLIVTLLMDPIGARMLRLLPQGSERFVEFALGNERVTTAEAKELLGVSVNTARRYLTALADAGFLRRESHSARDPHGYWRVTTGPVGGAGTDA